MYLQDPWLQKLRINKIINILCTYQLKINLYKDQIDRKYKNVKNIRREKKSARRHESTSTIKKRIINKRKEKKL